MWQSLSEKSARITLNVFLLGLVYFVFHENVITGNVLNDVSIASKTQSDIVCVDSTGANRSDQDEWTTSTGSCDRRVCHSKVNETYAYIINYDCPAQLTDIDTANCQYVSPSVTTFPGCCPEIQCTNGTLPNTTNPACYDRSPTTSCEFWRNLTNCMTNDTDAHIAFLYNATLGFCDKTCAICNDTET